MKALLSRVALASVLMGASVMATAAGMPTTPAPKDAEVFIVSPADGATVDKTFTVKFGAKVTLIDEDTEAKVMYQIVGDAELDEGNIYEALLEGWKHDIRNVWWVVDYNRQSLDSVVPDRLFGRIEGLFRDMGWNVVTIKYGRKLEAAFARPDGEHLRRWIDDCPNSLYAALTFQGGAAWRSALLAELGRVAGIRAIIDAYRLYLEHAAAENGEASEPVLSTPCAPMEIPPTLKSLM